MRPSSPPSVSYFLTNTMCAVLLPLNDHLDLGIVFQRALYLRFSTSLQRGAVPVSYFSRLADDRMLQFLSCVNYG